MKRLLSLITVLFLFICLCTGAVAASSTLADHSSDFTYDAKLPRVIDNAGLLTAAEKTQLNKTIRNIIKTYSFDVVLLTVESTDGKSIEAYADDYYDYNGYGYGQNADGLLFVVDMGSRAYWTSTTGEGITAFTDSGIAYMGSLIQDKLSEGDYYSAFSSYLNEVGVLLENYHSDGTPYDEYDDGDWWIVNDASGYTGNGSAGGIGSVKNLLKVIGISLAAGFIIAFIIVSVMKKKMNTAVPDNFARAYVESGSFKLTNSEDRFLYRTTTRVKVQTNNTRPGGGSSTHVGSSGRSHGGGGGHF